MEKPSFHLEGQVIPINSGRNSFFDLFAILIIFENMLLKFLIASCWSEFHPIENKNTWVILFFETFLASSVLKSFNSLIDIGNTIIIVEHNLELIKCSDYIIDLGPVGGDNGGYIIAQGNPENLINNNKSLTAKYLKEYLK